MGADKFNGFVLHLKESEWRYNQNNDDLLVLIKKLHRTTYFDFLVGQDPKN